GTVVLTGTIPQDELLDALAHGLTNGPTRGLTNTFPLGMHVVTFTVSDGQATASAATAVNVVDHSPPTLTCSSNLLVRTEPGKPGAVVNYTVTAKDDFPNVSLICLPPAGSVFPKGTTTVNCTAVDAGANR